MRHVPNHFFEQGTLLVIGICIGLYVGMNLVPAHAPHTEDHTNARAVPHSH